MRHLLSRAHICSVSHSHKASAICHQKSLDSAELLAEDFTSCLCTSSPWFLTHNVMSKWMVQWHQIVTANVTETVVLTPKISCSSWGSEDRRWHHWIHNNPVFVSSSKMMFVLFLTAFVYLESLLFPLPDQIILRSSRLEQCFKVQICLSNYDALTSSYITQNLRNLKL